MKREKRRILNDNTFTPLVALAGLCNFFPAAYINPWGALYLQAFLLLFPEGIIVVAYKYKRYLLIPSESNVLFNQ